MFEYVATSIATRKFSMRSYGTGDAERTPAGALAANSMLYASTPLGAAAHFTLSPGGLRQ